MDWNFDQEQVISNDISHQLASYQQTQKFFMTTYLVYTVIYNYILKELPVKKDIDISQEPIQFWYPMLQKHKAQFQIYQIHNSFLGRRKTILIRTIPDRISHEAKDFMEGKGQL